MRLIEKKCPNCGANLEFDENAKSCNCTYCKRSFEIERDLNDVDKFNLIYDKIHKPFQIAFFIPFIVAFVIILAVILTMIFGFRNNTSSFESGNEFIEDITEEDEGEKLLENASELTNDNLESIGHRCISTLNQSVVGRSDTTYSYQKTGDPRLEKIYVAYKEGSNRVISIYRVIYHNFFNQSDQHTVYVPVVFEDVEKSVSFSLANPKNPAPEYYLNSEQSSYIYAYASFEDAYNNVVKPLEGEYTITEK